MPMTPKTYNATVICLRAIDFGEADRILYLFSPDKGRFSAIAKGAKRTSSKLAGACEPLSISNAEFAEGRSLHVLRQYLPHKSFIGLRSDVMKLAYGLLLAELVNGTEAGNADSERVFEILCHALEVIDRAEEGDTIAIGLESQMALLAAAGVHPILDNCVLTEDELDAEALYYCFSPELGGLTTPSGKRRHQVTPGASATEWVNVSAKTIAILRDPHAATHATAPLLKAQRFLAYYFRKVFDKDLHAFRLIFNLLETMPVTDAVETEPVSIDDFAILANPIR